MNRPLVCRIPCQLQDDAKRAYPRSRPMRCPSCQSENEVGAESCFTCGQILSALIKRGSVIASRYEVVSPISKGGMGTVYLARDRVLSEKVAVKVLPPACSRPPDLIPP